jgi:adenylate kinase family enzyme
MKKVLAIGSSGAGKSVLSRRLGEISGIPVIHLDKHYWRSGWTEPPKDEWRDQVAKLLEGEQWIIDGNYSGTLEQRLESCDTVVFLDFPRLICTLRVLKRMLSFYGRTRPDLAEGCPERLDFAFLIWVWNYPSRSKPRVLERIANVADRVRVHRLTNNQQVEAFLAGLKQKYGEDGNGKL